MAGTASDIHVIVPKCADRSAKASRGGVSALLAPSLCDFFFLAVLLWLFMAGHDGWSSLLADADTGWHIRTGQYILQHGAVPQQDLFSFSKAGQPWFAWEWLSDVIFALAFAAFGFKGIVLLAGAMIGLFTTLLLMYTVWRGANALAALGVTLLAAGASTIHFLARPHVFTLVLFVAAVWLLDCDRARRTRAVWVLPLVTVLWTNLHGGFVILLVWIAVLAAEATARRAFSDTRRYATLLLACCAATFVNPCGWRLHEHLAGYLSSGWIREVVQEFQAPTFRGESQLQFELLLIGGIAAAALALARRDFVAALGVAVFAHLSLTSARHIPLFAVMAAPVIAVELTRLWDRLTAARPRTSVAGILHQLAADTTPKLRRLGVLPAVAVAALFFVPLGMAWPSDFPRELFPVQLVRANAPLLESERLFTTDQWGDYLIFHYWPRVRVFLDGRTDFYGRELGTEYIQLLNGQKQWRRVLDKYGFTAALVPPDLPAAALLRQDPAWRVVAEDKRAVLFVRVSGQGIQLGRLSGFRPGEGAGKARIQPSASGTECCQQANENRPADRSISQETRPS